MVGFEEGLDFGVAAVDSESGLGLLDFEGGIGECREEEFIASVLLLVDFEIKRRFAGLEEAEEGWFLVIRGFFWRELLRWSFATSYSRQVGPLPPAIFLSCLATCRLVW